MKVLIVEDNESLRDLLARILEHLDYLPVLASHGKDGLEKAITEKPDLILLIFAYYSDIASISC
jgi:two-component system cell cycle response regulator DivK